MTHPTLTSHKRDLAQEVREHGWVYDYIAYEDTLNHDPLWVRIAVKTFICWLDFCHWIKGKGGPA